jgi:phage FluMu gp28-like protein
MSEPAKKKIDRAYAKLEKYRERQDAESHPLITGDVVQFCVKDLHFNPYSYQERFLRDTRQFVLARWSRQSGKSHTIAALCLYLVLSQSYTKVVVLSPSLRQSRRMIAKISLFLSGMDRDFLAGRPYKTRLDFINGSSIEGLPNSPETIRGTTAHLVLVDELSFVLNDEDLYDAVVYMLGTTNGRFIAASTPGSRDSLFYKMCTDDKKFGHFSRHHVNWKEALEPNGPLKKQIVETIRAQMVEDPWRWQREMEAEFAVDEDAFFSYALIEKCVDPELEFWDDRDLVGVASN